MASKKEWRRRARSAVSAKVGYHEENEDLRGQLRTIDHLIARAEFPGPSLEEWAGQARTFLQELIKARQEKRAEGYQLDDLRAMKSSPNPVLVPHDEPVVGTFEMPSTEDLARWGRG